MNAVDDTLLDPRPRTETPTDPPEMTRPLEQSNTPTTQFAVSRLCFPDNSNRKTEPVRAIDLDGIPTSERLLDNGRYQIVERIGRGAAARVYKAIDRELACKGLGPVHVAIKLFKEDSPFGEEADERNRREVLATHKVQSEFICRNYCLLVLPNGRRGIVMEYIEGRTLMSFLEEGEPIDFLRAARWGSQIALGLAEAHKWNVVHRDLKPENIMIRSENDAACILDFGVARFFQEGSHITRTGFMIGTPLYMAPEQFGQPVDPRADLFALGLLLARLATGEVPLSGDSTDEQIFRKRVKEQSAYRLKDHAPHAPTEYAAIVDRLLALPREKRFSTGADVAAALQSFIRNAEADTRHPFGPPPRPPPPDADAIAETAVMRPPPLPPPAPTSSRIPPAKTAPLHGAQIASVARKPTPQANRIVPLLAGMIVAVAVLILLAVGAIAQGALKVELSPGLKAKLSTDSNLDEPQLHNPDGDPR